MIFFKPEFLQDMSENGNDAVIVAFDGDKRIGDCRITVDGYKCILSGLNVNSDDVLTVEGLIRSALNYAANRGAYIAESECISFKNTFEYLGFKSVDGKYSGEIPELLKGSCCKGSC